MAASVAIACFVAGCVCDWLLVVRDFHIFTTKLLSKDRCSSTWKGNTNSRASIQPSCLELLFCQRKVVTCCFTRYELGNLLYSTSNMPNGSNKSHNHCRLLQQTLACQQQRAVQVLMKQAHAAQCSTHHFSPQTQVNKTSIRVASVKAEGM